MYATLLPTWTAYREADAKRIEALAKWLAAVRKLCGPDALIEWGEDGNCTVQGVMVFTGGDINV